jgi:thymidylate synthase (FAD)
VISVISQSKNSGIKNLKNPNRTLKHGENMSIETTSELKVTWQETVGDDDMIARIARHDQEGGTKGILTHMMKNRHGSPFEFGFITFKCEIPLFVIQQMLRHRIGVSYSQWSLRWDEAIPKMYVPYINRPFIPKDRDQKNVRKNLYETHSHIEYNSMCNIMKISFEQSYRNYKALLSHGVTQELARNVLPAAQMSIIHVSFNPRSLMHFLSLRIDSPENRYPSHPQWEVEDVARKFQRAFDVHWPITNELFIANGRVAP